MKWVDGECQIASDFVAGLVEMPNGKFSTYIEIDDAARNIFWESPDYDSEAEAKAAVAHWIGKTMAQFSNALAQGFEQPDDGA